MNLWNLKPSQHGVISGFAETMDEIINTRLQELGFSPGHPVKCIMQPSFGAPRVYQVHQSVYSLDKEVAENINVDLIEGTV